jgi:hypothetical protein
MKKLYVGAVLLMSSTAAFAATPGAAKTLAACCSAIAACCGAALPCCD